MHLGYSGNRGNNRGDSSKREEREIALHVSQSVKSAGILSLRRRQSCRSRVSLSLSSSILSVRPSSLVSKSRTWLCYLLGSLARSLSDAADRYPARARGARFQSKALGKSRVATSQLCRYPSLYVGYREWTSCGHICGNPIGRRCRSHLSH